MPMTFPGLMTPKINWQWILKMGIYFLLFFLLIGNLLTLSYGSEDLRMIHVFSIDEANGVRGVLTNLKYDDLNPRGFYNYGYFYQTTGFHIVKTLKYFGFSVDAMLVALVMRLISLISYALAGIIICKLYITAFKGSNKFGLILAFFLLEPLGTPGSLPGVIDAPGHLGSFFKTSGKTSDYCFRFGRGSLRHQVFGYISLSLFIIALRFIPGKHIT